MTPHITKITMAPRRSKRTMKSQFPTQIPNQRNYPNRKGRKGQPDTELGKRGAAVALAKTGLPFSDITKITKIPERTVHDIVHHANENAKRNTENSDALANVNLKSNHRIGRPIKFNDMDRKAVIQLATANASQRRKTYTLLAKECTFQISRHTFATILHDAGYNQCIPEEKPNISAINIQKRLEFCTEHIEYLIVGYWDGWIFTDEMSLVVGSHYGPIRVHRNKHENIIQIASIENDKERLQSCFGEQ